ncbi:MAG TPA: hypothetical protein V6C65_14150 [Allocoleopsis sp.]
MKLLEITHKSDRINRFLLDASMAIPYIQTCDRNVFEFFRQLDSETLQCLKAVTDKAIQYFGHNYWYSYNLSLMMDTFKKEELKSREFLHEQCDEDEVEVLYTVAHKAVVYFLPKHPPIAVQPRKYCNDRTNPIENRYFVDGCYWQKVYVYEPAIGESRMEIAPVEFH